MKKNLSLLIFLVLFSAHLSYGKDLLLLGALMENDQMKEGVYIDIELTNKQPDPESYTLTGENFLIVKILNFTKDKLLYYNVFFNKSSFSLKNDPLGEIIELYQGIYVNNEIAILRAKAGHYIVITSVNEKNQTFVFSKNSAAAEEFMPFLKDAIIKSGIKDFWEIEDEQITESTKIEPYQSTAVRDIRKKKDLTFDDIFYLGRENTTLKEFKRYYPFTHGSINLGLSHTLYGHPVSDFGFSKDYKDFWHCSCYVYFGESKSKSAIDEANKFMQDIYAYLIKRGRNVTMTMGGNSSYPDCYFLKFNEGGAYHSDIGVVDGGLYHKTNGEAAWGVVIHMSYYFK